MKKLLSVAVVVGGLTFAGTTRSHAQVYFSSGSVRAITDIIPTVTILRTGITPDLITTRTIGTADIIITAIIIPIITDASLTGIVTPGWFEAISSHPNFLGEAR